MDNELKYFEDRRFVNWVLNPNDELNDYWETYLREHPSERKQIMISRLLIQQLKSKNEMVNRDESAALYSSFILKLKNKNRRYIKSSHFRSFLKYAAVAVLFLSLGGLLFYFYQNGHDLAKYYALEEIHFEDEAKLILSDGKKILLHEKATMIDHGNRGIIVINRQDTIGESRESAESEMNQLIMPYGKNSSLKLPDGTIVYINAGSTLIYPGTFKGKAREVFLLGEALFHVAHNPAAPFVVKTNDLSVTALGTYFNISAYPTDKTVQTVLLEGKVVIRENSFKLRNKDIELQPDDLAIFNRESLETDVSKIDGSNFITWHLGYLNFLNEDLSNVIARLERYYNIKIYLDNPVLGKKRISGKLVLEDDKEKVLDVLVETSDVSLHKLKGNTYVIK